MGLASALVRGVLPSTWQGFPLSTFPLPRSERVRIPNRQPARGAGSRAVAAAAAAAARLHTSSTVLAWRASPVHSPTHRNGSGGMDEDRTTNFNDPVYGDEGIKLPRQFLKVVDTPEFQRLRSIKQLGAATFVFHGATHTCFEHSLGVAHLAREAALTLRQQGNLAFEVTDSDVKVVTLAGLCYNLGRPPFLDALQLAQLEPVDCRLQRKRSALLFERICDREGAAMGVTQEEKTRVVAALEGKADPQDKTPLFDIINGPDGVGVVTVDHLVRDAIYCNMDTVKFYPRLTSSLKILTSKEGAKPKLCWNLRYRPNIIEVFRQNERMQREVYMQPKVDAISYMIADILNLAENHCEIKTKLEPTAADGFLSLDDTLLTYIDTYRGSDEGMLAAQALLHRIYHHDVYRCVGERLVPSESLFACDAPEGVLLDRLPKSFTKDDFLMSCAQITWSSSNKEPMKALHWFYEGHDSKTCQVEKDTSMLPNDCFERKLRVYLKTPKASAGDKASSLYRCFSSYCHEQLGPGPVTKPEWRDPDMFEVRDRIYGKVVLPGMYGQVIQHPYFYRMKDIAQLGACSYVYYGGSHTRFEHSLGVGYLAYETVTKLKEEDSGLGITEKDVMVVTLAGLCHDLGHGPFSHLFESVAKKLLPKEHRDSFTHERMSCMVFHGIMEDLRAQEGGAENPMLCQEVEDRVANAIQGDREAEAGKSYLVDIISNSVNGIDVDKLDYLVRDATYTNYMQLQQFKPLLENVRVVDGHLSWPVDAAPLIANMYSQRANMHRQVYQHPRGKAIEFMLHELLVEAGRAWNLGENLLDAKGYVQLRGDILNRVQHSDAASVAKGLEKEEAENAAERQRHLAMAKALAKRIRQRDIYRLVAEVKVPEDKLNSEYENITAAQVIELLRKDAGLGVEDIKVWNKKLDWPKSGPDGEKNPMTKIIFHELTDDKKPEKVEFAVRDLMMVPRVSRECSVVLFLKKTDGGPKELESRIRYLSLAFNEGSKKWFGNVVAHTPNKGSSSKKRQRSAADEADRASVKQRMSFSDAPTSAAL